MTTLYIAGPMTGLPEFNYPAFNEAADRLRAAGYSVLNPVDSEQENTTGQPQEWRWYMRRALRMVTHADAIALLPGWEKSRGARLEYEVGGHLGMVMGAVEHWLSMATAHGVQS